MTCSVADCTREALWTGLCNPHYLRKQRYGSPTGSPPPRMTEQRRFFEDALARETDECIEWPYGKQKGYGAVRIAGERKMVHVEALTRKVGPPPPGMVALHGPCHNRACFNPRHLSWGTRAQNQLDRFRDGTDAIGERHPNALLTDEQVREIRASSATGAELATRYGVARRTIYGIRQGKTWRHLL